uniref:Olfactory receptor n=1 Tax=Leptobrachium leishanense TaxID=445787 RepID=A0A8C5M7T7_9ANUR
MFGANHTVPNFLLLGFQNLQTFNYVLVVLFFLIYTFTVTSNLLIVVLVAMAPSLKTPMYFFFTQLSVSDILLSTNITPNMLHVLLNGGSTISVTGCITQLGVHSILTATECLFLTVMSYDRYVAICNPLHYVSIMSHKICVQMIMCSWLSAFLLILVILLLISKLRFCGHQIFDHYFCDFGPLLELSCSEQDFIFIIHLVDYALATLLAFFPFVYISFTYICIFITIFGISSTQKAFSTCSSHLIVVSMYYGTLIMVYMAPSKGHSLNFNKLLSLLYTAGTPCLNPIIYSLRNQEIKKAFMRCVMSFSHK